MEATWITPSTVLTFAIAAGGAVSTFVATKTRVDELAKQIEQLRENTISQRELDFRFQVVDAKMQGVSDQLKAMSVLLETIAKKLP